MSTVAVDNPARPALDDRLFAIGAGLALVAIFSIPLFGTAVFNSALGLSVLALLCSRQLRSYPDILRHNRTALLALLLFAIMALSLGWAAGELGAGADKLKKYKELLLLPLLMICVAAPKCGRLAFWVLYIALVLALLASFLIHYDWVDWGAGGNSLKKRIFHGISTGFLAYMSLQLAAHARRYRGLFVAVYGLVVFNLFFVENGRTGYLVLIGLSALFCWQQWRWRGALVAVGMVVALAIYGLADAGQIRLLDRPQLLRDGQEWTLAILQQADIRLEFYLVSLQVLADNWLLGVGLGDFASAYQRQQALMTTYWYAPDNPHNEFLNIATQTGVVGLLLFVALLLSVLIPRSGDSLVRRQYRVAVFLLMVTACLFNSSFMDHGDGALFMVLMALFCGPIWHLEAAHRLSQPRAADD